METTKECERNIERKNFKSGIREIETEERGIETEEKKEVEGGRRKRDWEREWAHGKENKRERERDIYIYINIYIYIYIYKEHM